MTNDTTERVLIGSKDVMRMLNIGRTTLHRVRTKDSVSYTHLTLPTKRIV